MKKEIHDDLNIDLINKLVKKSFNVGDKESFLYKTKNDDLWNLTITRDENKYSPYIFILEGNKSGTNEKWNRRYTSIENAILHIVNDFNENSNIKDNYKDLNDYIKKENGKYKVVNENKYRYYIYDWLIGQHLITIDTVKNRSKFDSFNIYGQCYSLGGKWDKITKATINRALNRSGYVYDKFIKEHFIVNKRLLEDEILFQSNDYNECIKFLADYGAEFQNCTSYKGDEYNKRYKNYYKKYLDIPENKIGEILKDGTVKKEYFQDGYIYKNICNFYRQDGICYISENQTDKVTKRSKPGVDYETYQTIYEKVKEVYQKEGIDEKKYKLKDFVETIFNDLTWQSVDALIMDSIDALDDEFFLENEEETI